MLFDVWSVSWRTLPRCHVAQVKRRHAAVLAEIVIGDCVDEPFAVGRKLRPSEPSHLPHHLRGETSRGDLFGRERVVDFERPGPLRTGAESQNRTCHKQEKFFHICRVGFLHFVQIFVLLPEQIVCFMCRTIYFADKILLFSSRPVGEPYHEIPLEAGTTLPQAKILNFLETFNFVAVVTPDPTAVSRPSPRRSGSSRRPGGAVVNDRGERLMIYRNGRWDLPKGHWERARRLRRAPCARFGRRRASRLRSDVTCATRSIVTSCAGSGR